MTATARKTPTTKKKATATALVDLGPYPFPKRTDFFFDFPKRTDFGLAALAVVPEPVGPGLAACPRCGSTELYEGEVNKKGFVTNEDIVGGCHRCDFSWDLRKLSKGAAGNAAGVAASWKRPEIAAARTTRHGVTVTFDGKTTQHASTHQAFTAYRLPVQKCIRFRLALKASGREHFEHNGKMYSFALVVKDSQ